MCLFEKPPEAEEEVCVVFLEERAPSPPRFSGGVDYDMLRWFGTWSNRLFLAFCVLSCLKDLGAVNINRNDGYQECFVLLLLFVYILLFSIM